MKQKSLILLSITLMLSLEMAIAAPKLIKHTPVQKSKIQQLKDQKAVQKPLMINDFSFRECHFGDPAEEVLKKSIKHPKKIDECLRGFDNSVEESCTDSRENWMQIPDPDPLLNGANRFLMYHFVKGKFSGITYTFPDFEFTNIKNMLIGKYGEPHSFRTYTVQNGAGVVMDAVEVIWYTKHGPMSLAVPAFKSDTGKLEIYDQELTKEAAELNKQIDLLKGKKAF